MPFWDLFCCNGDRDEKQKPDSRRSKRDVTIDESPRTKTRIKRKQSKKAEVEEALFKKKEDVYDGEELNALPHGTGTKNYANGDYYRGEWVNGLKEGRGIHYYFEVEGKYEG